MRLLLIEDDEPFAERLARGLRENAYAVDIASDGGHGAYLASIQPYDLIILDVLLPNKDGLEVCSTLRLRGDRTPILMLTARDTLDDRVRGLDAGADDYLTKPFAFPELLARLRALLRRAPSVLPPVYKIEDLTIDTRSRSVMRGHTKIDLTAKEYAILELLARESGAVVTRSEICDHVWDSNHDPAMNLVDVYMSRLRRKLDVEGAPALLHTRKGFGYTLAPVGG